MKDLTVIFLTLNRLPKAFAAYHEDLLVKAVGDYPLICISRVPMSLGENVVDDSEIGYINVYRQMLRGARLAGTPYVAVAEDDTLYCPEHFSFYRPDLDTFAYNQNRWALFTWGVPTYSMRQRKSNCSLIAPRDLMIAALEERFEKYPDYSMPEQWTGELGRARVDKWLGVTVRKSVEVYSETSIVQFNHSLALAERQRRRRKSLGQIKAFDIPYWGKAEDLVKQFK